VFAVSVSAGMAFASPSPSGFGRAGFNGSRQQACRQTASGDSTFAGAALADPLDAVAYAIKLEPTTLQSELASGTSLSQIIQQQGMTGDQVVAAVVMQEKAQLDQEVAAARLSADQENATLATTQAGIEQVIAGNAPLTGSASRSGGFSRGGAPNGQSAQTSRNGQSFNPCGG